MTGIRTVLIFILGSCFFHVLSRVSLPKKRRCRGAWIHRYYVLAELLGGTIAVLCLYVYGISFRGAAVFIFLSILTAVSVVDIDTMRIPPSLTAAAAAVGVLSCPFFPEISLAAKRKGKRDSFAFGPFLCAGMATALFAGETVWNWLKKFF